MQVTARIETRTSGLFRQRAARFSQAVYAAETASAQLFLRRAVSLSQGGYSTQALQRLARQTNAGRGVYSQASPMPPLDLSIVNNQGAKLAQSWRAQVDRNSDGTSLRLFNVDPNARYVLQGTRTLIARTTLQKVYELENPARLQRLLQAQRAALK